MQKESIDCKLDGQKWQFETGKLAGQANAAVLGRLGDTVVLATVVMSDRIREGMDFFPLLVDYEERLYAAGKIKGSRWVKREGKATDEAILTGRVVDRTIRPLFPDGMRNDVQVVTTVLSIDGVNDPDMVALNSAGLALAISDVPFDGPVAGVRVGKVDGKLIVNPTNEERAKSSLDLIVSGTGDHIMMVEAGAHLIVEEEIVEAIRFAQKYLGILASVQTDFAKRIGKSKQAVTLYQPNQQIMDTVKDLLTDARIDGALYVPDKVTREMQEQALYKELEEQIKQKFGELEGVNLAKDTTAAVDKLIKKHLQKQILQNEKRVDGRKLDETRKITCEVGVLPRTHGSALFSRGETQALTIVTLGSKGDEQTLDGMEDPSDGRAKRYIHHYNMPGYSVGEVAPMRGPGRREIGHGALAERAVEVVLPTQEAFPYTMRLVSEVLSSNGSTSMASTCGSTMALMDAGVPISQPIGGVAMGLVMDESDPSNFKVLTDIAGIEDANGHMDFKVTGSETGITALQLDIKVKGLTADILAKALDQAKPGRMHILSVMKETLASPRPDLSPYAPRITSFMIDPEKIREVIGTGGKVINSIIDETGVKIDIEDSGLVMVTSIDAAASEKAVTWIKNIARKIQVGEEFEGKVTRIMNFGAFVEFLPGKEGMVHVSELANYHVGRVEDVVKVGDALKVKVKEIDEQGRINLTHKPYAPEPRGLGTTKDKFRGTHGAPKLHRPMRHHGGGHNDRGGDRGHRDEGGFKRVPVPRPKGGPSDEQY